MSRARVRPVLLGLIAAGLVLGVGVGVTAAAFFSTTSNSGNSFSAAPDFVPPQASTSVIAKTTGFLAGSIRQGGTYFVYANVTDTGNPPSGVTSVTANVATITTGQTAAPLAAGSFSANGVSYNYRSASLTANSPLAAGSYAYTLSLTDTAANSQTQSGFSVVVDNTAPSGTNVQTANGATTVGRPETGDTVTLTFSEPMEPNSVLAGWTGAATTVQVRITNNVANDLLTIRNSAGTAQLPLGTVSLQGNYVGVTRNFTSSTMVMSGSAITVTLGTPSGTVNTVAAANTMTWTPQAAATDAAGNACSIAVASESSPADVEF